MPRRVKERSDPAGMTGREEAGRRQMGEMPQQVPTPWFLDTPASAWGQRRGPGRGHWAQGGPGPPVTAARPQVCQSGDRLLWAPSGPLLEVTAPGEVSVGCIVCRESTGGTLHLSRATEPMSRHPHWEPCLEARHRPGGCVGRAD